MALVYQVKDSVLSFSDAISHERYKYYPYAKKRSKWKDKLLNFY